MQLSAGSSKKIISICLVLLIFFLFVFWYFYYFWIKDTGESYSFTQTWKEYHSLEDWNVPGHARADIDGDGKEDLFTFTNCVFLSSVLVNQIPEEKQCKEPGMSVMVFGNEDMTGQVIVSERSFGYPGLRKSYLVKTQSDVWKFYDMNGFQLRTFVLADNKLFKEEEPTLLDRVDVLSYQITHLPVLLFLILLPY